MSTSSKLLYSVGVGLGVTMLSATSYYFYKYWKKDVMPTNWRRVGTLAELGMFPVKSCGPLKLQGDEEFDCEVLGLRLDGFRDRSLMVITVDNAMITARAYPKMVLIATTKLGPTRLQLSSPNMPEPLVLDFATLVKEGLTRDVHTEVWGVKLDAMLCGEKYDKWMSKCILDKDSGLRLVYYPYPKPVRTIVQRLKRQPYLTAEDTGTFPDATSYMLINLSSIDEMNTRLKTPASHRQFRGNFYLKMDNDESYAEDHWNWVKIGDEAVFRVVAPCTRCIFPNINVETGERDPDGNPLKTLNTYRKVPNHSGPVMGVHLGVRLQGKVKLNDVIYVEDK